MPHRMDKGMQAMKNGIHTATWLVAALCAVLGGCVSTTTSAGEPEPIASNDTTSDKTPAEVGIRRRISRLPYQRGPALLAELEALVAYREFALPIIEEQLETVDTGTKANLLYVVGFCRSPESHRILSRYVGSPESAVRFEAAAGLVQHADWSAVPLLLDFMRADDKKLRYKSFQVLRETTQQDFGYRFDAPDSVRAASMKGWDAWWATRRGKLIYNDDKGQ